MFRNPNYRNQRLTSGRAKKRDRALVIITLFVLLLALSQAMTACQAGVVQSTATEEVQASSTPLQEPTQVEAPTSTSEQDTATATIEPESSTPLQVPSLGEPMPGCTVVSFNPTPEPTLQALFPLPGEGDWIKGLDTAAVTIIEYSDFQ